MMILHVTPGYDIINPNIKQGLPVVHYDNVTQSIGGWHATSSIILGRFLPQFSSHHHLGAYSLICSRKEIVLLFFSRNRRLVDHFSRGHPLSIFIALIFTTVSKHNHLERRQ